MNNNIGKIVSVAVKNFLTYDEVRLNPGSNLNIIIGPNGSGKSSIFAAIILGCGGNPSILSRASNLSDYVKNGKIKAAIEIELAKNDEEDTTILSRQFDRNSMDLFKIDGQNVTPKVYSETVKNNFNIHIDNLCMFLPQDRVQDFTTLNPQEILYNTQTIVCSQEIVDTFELLKELRNEQNNEGNIYASTKARLEDYININNRVSSLIENSKLKEKLIREMDIHKKKLNWLYYDRTKEKYDEAVNDVKILQDSIKNKKSLMKPLEKRQSEIEETKKKFQTSLSKCDTLMAQYVRDIVKFLDTSNNLESEVNNACKDLRNNMANAKNHNKIIKEQQFHISLDRKDFQEAKQEIQNEGDINTIMHNFDDNIRNNNIRIEDVMQDMENMNRTLEDNIIPQINNCKRKIEQMSDTKRQQFNILQKKFEDAYQAYQWLEAHRSQFRGRIYNPIVTEITVKDQKYAKYVENTISNRDLEMFLCTDKDDMKELIIKLRNELNLKVNVGYIEPDETLHYKSEPIDQNLKKLGIFGFLVDYIDGPIPILNYLCSSFKIHKAALGNDKTFENASQVPDNIGLFFSTDYRFVVKVSSYSGKKSTLLTKVISRNILNTGVDPALFQEEEKRLHGLIKKSEEIKALRIPLQQQIKKIEEQQNVIRNKKNVLNAKMRNLKTIEKKIMQKEAELENLRKYQIDINDEKQKCKNKVDQIIKSILANNIKSIQNLEKYMECCVESALVRNQLLTFDESTENMDEQIEKLKCDLNKVEETFRCAKNVTRHLQEELNQKKENAMKETNGQSPDDPKFQYKNEFRLLPDTPEELLDKFFEIECQISCIRDIDPKILAEYEERKEMIEKLEYEVIHINEQIMELENRLQALHEKWFPEIKRVVEAINNNFSTFFAKMGFVGEVELIRDEERDYDNYGIQIRVQYRDNEKLEALSRHVQSGGERAVAIAIYTLSLQHLMVVPFRCVDEINQGMDSKNERKIFQMLVDITCKPGHSQYFFVTPKLLPNLPYNDLMTINIVHNGRYIKNSFYFTLD